MSRALAPDADGPREFGKRRFRCVRGRDLVHERAKDGDAQALSELLANGADPDSCDGFGESALEAALMSGSSECMDLLIKHGAFVDPIDDHAGATLLMRAVSAERPAPALVAKLLDAGSDQMAKDRQGWAPLHWASAGGSVEMVELLAARGGLHEGKAPLLGCALEFAMRRGSPELARMLAERWSLERLGELAAQGWSWTSVDEGPGAADAAMAAKAVWERRSLEASLAPGRAPKGASRV